MNGSKIPCNIKLCEENNLLLFFFLEIGIQGKCGECFKGFTISYRLHTSIEALKAERQAPCINNIGCVRPYSWLYILTALKWLSEALAIEIWITVHLRFVICLFEAFSEQSHWERARRLCSPILVPFTWLAFCVSSLGALRSYRCRGSTLTNCVALVTVLLERSRSQGRIYRTAP